MHNKKPAMAGFEQTDFLLPCVGINRIKFKGSDPSSQSFDSPSMNLLYHMASIWKQKDSQLSYFKFIELVKKVVEESSDEND